MDIATLLGFIAAVSVVIMAIAMGNELGSVVNLPSFVVVVGGSLGVVLMRFSLGQFFGAIKIALKAFFNKSEDINKLIPEILELSDTAKKNGVLALEKVEIKSKFLKSGIQHVVDGLDPQVVEDMLYKDLDATLDRHKKGQQIFKALGDVAPAMGMIGTLIGLVQMLSNLSDPGSLGPAMAVAMLTTLYGAIIAHLIALPIVEKLELRSKEEELVKSLIIDSILSIQKGQNTRILHDILKTYLPSSKREAEGKEKASAA